MYLGNEVHRNADQTEWAELSNRKQQSHSNWTQTTDSITSEQVDFITIADITNALRTEPVTQKRIKAGAGVVLSHK